MVRNYLNSLTQVDSLALCWTKMARSERWTVVLAAYTHEMTYKSVEEAA